MCICLLCVRVCKQLPFHASGEVQTGFSSSLSEFGVNAQRIGLHRAVGFLDMRPNHQLAVDHLAHNCRCPCALRTGCLLVQTNGAVLGFLPLSDEQQNR